LNLFDNSDYPKNHALYDNKNKKVVLKFKDELSGVEMVEFVGLASKLYSFSKPDGKDKITCKGVKANIKNMFNVQQFKKCLFQQSELMAKVQMFGTKNHTIYSMEQNKLAISCFDNKRFILDDSINTMAYGHYKLKN
jgi:hypothetical protein